MENNSFLILRKQKYWDYNKPVFYLGHKNPNKDLIKVGSQVIIEKEMGGEIKFIGYGEIDLIETISSEQTFNPDHTWKIHFKNYVSFLPPRMKNYDIRTKLRNLPNYRWYDSIRPIPKNIFYQIIDFCSIENWYLFLEEIPFVHSESKSINDLLSENESDILEFKSSMLSVTKLPSTFNHDENSNTLENIKKAESNIQDKIQKEIITTISSFLNAKGGTLIVGVEDNKNIIGIENDYNQLSKKKNWDGWCLHLRNLLEKYMDKQVIHQVKLKSYIINDKTIARIDIPPSPKPIYLRYGNNEGDFHVRSFTSSEKLNTEQAIDYIDIRWKKIAIS